MDFAAVADALERAATAMETNPRLDPDGAVRLAVWGNAETLYPGDDTPGALTFDSASSAIECFCGWQGNGIDRIPRDEAITAARSEAARYRSYGGGR
ncbi:hypothetical protein ACIQI8_27320 [Streptomyces sp. NPDC092369]|uniref:hypothetical protein n=1 Tax=Streptomyces sp. NPDC092369 TaxID=3366015 RepID=UPI0037F50BBF